MSDESQISSLNNFSEYLISKNFSIADQYTTDGVCIFLRVFSGDTGDDFILSVGKNHNIRSSDGIELSPFTDTGYSFTKINHKNSYGEINSEGIEEDTYLDPKEVDRMMEQYGEIDLDSEKAEILRENISKYKNQLERLKFCTNNIKYKLSIFTNSSLCIINRANSVECFAVKRSNPVVGEDKNLCIVIDIETFIDTIDSFTGDIKKIIKNLHNILATTQDKQSLTIISRIKKLQVATTPLVEKYSKKEKYQSSIDKLTFVLVKIKKQEKELLSRMKKLNVQNSSTTIEDTEIKSFTLKNIEGEYDKLMNFKNETVDLLYEIKSEYNNFLLNFDYALFDTLYLLNGIYGNLKTIGIIKCKK